MKEVEFFITEYLDLEAKARLNSLKPDIEKFNGSLKVLHSKVVSEMIGMLGMVELEKPESEDFYEDYKNIDVYNPRHLFKISYYNHYKYSEVWVCYTSQTNPRLRFPILSIALFVIKVEGEFKIARNYVYSDKGGMSKEYNWEGFSGLQDLTFESLGDLIAVERYLEPKDKRNALMLYNQEA